MKAACPPLTSGHKQLQHIVKEGPYDNRVLTPGPMAPDPSKSLFAGPMPREHLPHPVLSGHALKGGHVPAQTASDRHRMNENYRRR